MKNDQIIVYILVVILFGFVGYLIYSRMITKEKYNQNAIITTSGCSGYPQSLGYLAYYTGDNMMFVPGCYQNCYDVAGYSIYQVNNPDGTYNCYMNGCPSSNPFMINEFQGAPPAPVQDGLPSTSLTGTYSNVCYAICPSAYPKTAGNTCVNSCKYDGVINNEQTYLSYLVPETNNCVATCPKYYYFDSNQNDNVCVNSCPPEAPYLLPGTNQCVQSCSDNESGNNYPYYYQDKDINEKVCTETCPSQMSYLYDAQCVSDCSQTPNPKILNKTCVNYPNGSWTQSCDLNTHTYENNYLCASCNLQDYWGPVKHNWSCVSAEPSDYVTNNGGYLENRS